MMNFNSLVNLFDETVLEARIFRKSASIDDHTVF